MGETLEQVMETLAANREAIRRFGVRRLALFGSCARGEEAPSSDLDFLVEFDEDSFDAYMDLKFFLEELFGCKRGGGCQNGAELAGRHCQSDIRIAAGGRRGHRTGAPRSGTAGCYVFAREFALRPVVTARHL